MKHTINNFAKGLFILMAITSSLAHAGQGGNGGAGVNINGRLMTFYSAGFYTEPNEATAEEVPQLPQLIQFMNQTQYMSETTKVRFVQALVPSSDRKYYKVQPNTFTPEVRARLVATYGEVMHVNTSEIAIFAITDQTSKTTYLFPEFYSLTPIEQQAILFHESFWIVHPDATYAQVVNAEMSFQAYLTNPGSGDRLLQWLKTSGTFGDTTVAALNSDLRTGSMKGLVRGRQISFQNLVGSQFIECKNRALGSECRAFLVTYAYQLTLHYPSSLFIKLFYEKLLQNKYAIDFTSSPFSSGEDSLLDERFSLDLHLDALIIDLGSPEYSSSAVFYAKRSQSNDHRYDVTLRLNP